MVFGVFLLYAYLPLLNEQHAIEQARSSSKLSSAIELLRASVKSSGHGSKEDRVFLYEVTPFVQVSVPYFGYWDDESSTPFVQVNTGVPTVSLRLDQVILIGSLIIMLALTLRTLYPSSEEIVSVNVTQALVQATNHLNHSTPHQVFAHEVKHAEFRAETLFKRSTYLLTGGVLMAFVGVAVFYATLPEPLREESASSYWIRAFRSGGMLIFLEAIAWFLLRQYRSLIEDFKAFHRIYMKRANYLAVITVLDKGAVRAEDLILVTALLGEDLSGKLSKGESTEALENTKNEGVNPVFLLVQDAIGKALGKQGSDTSGSS